MYQTKTKMNNRAVCAEFVRGEFASGSNLMSTGTGLFSYVTLIAKKKGNKIWMTRKKYSPTTSTHQNMCRKAARDAGMEIVEVDHLDA